MILQTYDLDADTLYIKVSDRAVGRTVQLDSGTLADLATDGGLIGIEVIQPQRAWPLDDILTRFGVSEHEAIELRAYFPQPSPLRPPTHPGLRVAVAVS